MKCGRYSVHYGDGLNNAACERLVEMDANRLILFRGWLVYWVCGLSCCCCCCGGGGGVGGGVGGGGRLSLTVLVAL